MAFAINRSVVLGHVGQDVKVSSMQNGNTVANFSVATSERFKDRSGEMQERTEWHNVVAFGRQAEIARDYISKGSKVYVEGKLQTRSWEKEGVKQYRTEIIVQRLGLLDGKQDGNGRSNGYSASTSGNNGSYDDTFGDTELDEDLIPF